VRARYCWDPLLVRGANPGMKKWRRGNGTMLTASFLKSAFNYKKKIFTITQNERNFRQSFHSLIDSGLEIKKTSSSETRGEIPVTKQK